MAKRGSKPRQLSPRRETFVEALAANGGNATAAGQAGYPPRSAKTMGSRLLNSADIQARIKQRALEAAGLTNGRV